jgi:Leucine rich repeat
MEMGHGLLFIALALPACQQVQWSEFAPSAAQVIQVGGQTQQGTVALRAGDEVHVTFSTPFGSPPRISIVEMNQSWFKEKPYSAADFEVIKVDAKSFTLRNKHPEKYYGSWAAVKWRAEGAPRPPGTPLTPREQLVARVKQLGGHVTISAGSQDTLITSVDLHRTSAGDADLALLQGQLGLRTLNLYGTKVTDAGLVHLGGLTSLQTLYLNNTAVSDAGLQPLVGLSKLAELGLHHTQVTDQGLPTLARLTSLQTLYLSGNAITDQGLAALKGMRGLKVLNLSGTHVTAAGVQELSRMLNHTHVIH